MKRTKTEMFITFRDEVGYSVVEVDGYGLQFLDGIAYFSDGEHEYRVPVDKLEEIYCHAENE